MGCRCEETAKMTRILQVLIVALCAWDTACTQYVIHHKITEEANPLMSNVIDVCGWPLMWVIKIGFGLMFAYSVPCLIKSKWGKVLMTLVYGGYSLLAVSHVILIAICKR